MERLGSFLTILFILSSLFPYVCVGPCFDSDLQPLSFGLATGFFLLGLGRTHLKLLPFGFLVGCSLLLLLLEPTWAGLRNAIGYLGLFVYGNVFFRFYSRGDRDLLILMTNLAVALCLIVAVVQHLVARDFFTFLVSHSRTTLTRGVTSIMPEPSAFINNIALMLLLIFFTKKQVDLTKKNFLVGAAFLSAAAFLGSSLSSIIIVGLCLAILFIHRIVFLPIVIIVVAFFSVFAFDPDLFSMRFRIVGLLRYAFSDPFTLIFRDNSANDRLAHILGSIYGFIESGGMPHGFSAWTTYVISPIKTWHLFKNNDFISDQRVMSALGSAFFELGALALLPVFSIFFSLAKLYGRRGLQIGLGIFCFLWMNPISLNTPLLGMLLGVLYGRLEELKESKTIS